MGCGQSTSEDSLAITPNKGKWPIIDEQNNKKPTYDKAPNKD